MANMNAPGGKASLLQLLCSHLFLLNGTRSLIRPGDTTERQSPLPGKVPLGDINQASQRIIS